MLDLNETGNWSLEEQHPAPTAWDDVSNEVLTEVQARLEPIARKAADDLYGDLLYAVQDYFADNVRFNIASRIAASDRQARIDRERAFNAEKLNSEMLAALIGLNESILGRAESNASGNPEWEYVSRRINAARAVIAKVTGAAQ